MSQIKEMPARAAVGDPKLFRIYDLEFRGRKANSTTAVFYQRICGIVNGFSRMTAMGQSGVCAAHLQAA